MKKAISMFLAGTIALGAVSCKKNENNPNPNPKGKTSMRVVAYEGNGSLKAVTSGDAEADAVGVGAESKIANGLFITLSTSNDVTFTPLNSPTPALTGTQEAIFQTEPFEYKGAMGLVKAALVLNPYSLISDDDRATFNKAKDRYVGISALESLVSEDGFTMTSKAVADADVNIEKGLTEEKVKAADNTKNIFSFEVERVASKVQVFTTSNGLEYGDEFRGKYMATTTISDLRYGVAGSAKRVYLFADHAGSRTMGLSGSTKKYTGFTSAIHTNLGNDRDLTKVSDTSNNVVALGTRNDDNFDLLHSLVLQQIGENANVNASNGLAAANAANETARGIYFLENSIDKTVTETEQLMYDEVVYVKVYGTMTFADGNTPVKKWDDENGVFVGATKTEVMNAQRPEETIKQEGQEEPVTVRIPAGTFFQGQDGYLYLTHDDAEKAGNKKYKMFKGGRMYWKLPANNVVDPNLKLTVYADTRRNNIYSLRVDKIIGIGDNWDSVDPNDPNVPKPENPNEPDKPTPEPINPAHTFIKCKATILKWNVVNRGVELN